jgi:hypothetical protein
MRAPEEGVLDEGVDYEGQVVTLDLAFLLQHFLCDGNKINLRVIQGIPEDAKPIAAGILDNALVIVFDKKVPAEILFEDLSVIPQTKMEIN